MTVALGRATYTSVELGFAPGGSSPSKPVRPVASDRNATDPSVATEGWKLDLPVGACREGLFFPGGWVLTMMIDPSPPAAGLPSRNTLVTFVFRPWIGPKFPLQS